jgi:hypothetical protein
MKIGRLARPVACSFAAGVMLVSSAEVVSAQSHDDHGGKAASSASKPSPQENDLVKLVRDATDRFSDVTVAIAAGYNLMFGCVSGGEFGAMGLHYVNGPLVFDGELDASRPEIVLYEPRRNGGVRITGADYLVLKRDWDAKHASPPELGGQLFHLFEEPNRFGLPAFYTLHVWAWKENPAGTFGNWNPNVSCDAFNPRVP